MKKYGVMIVGTGWVSGEHIRAFEMTERAQVTAIVSRSREKGEAKCGSTAWRAAVRSIPTIRKV